MQELDGFNIPDISPTADGTCVGDPVAASNASSRGWWTCGGYTRVTDIVACPDKLTWGVRYVKCSTLLCRLLSPFSRSFDDGPGFYSEFHCLLSFDTQLLTTVML